MEKLPESVLVKRQSTTIEYLNVMYNGRCVDLLVHVRYDDSCGNGHNTFSVTGDCYSAGKRGGRAGIAHGSIPDIVTACSSQGPMHYMANTLYLAGNKDCQGKKEGGVIRCSERLYFGDFPTGVKVGNGLLRHLKEGLLNGGDDWNVTGVEHPHSDHDYGHNYQLSGQPPLKWHECHFESDVEALEFVKALKLGTARIGKMPELYSQGKEPELEEARRAAIWPDATLEQLQDEKALLDRLPSLMKVFKSMVESLGFTY